MLPRPALAAALLLGLQLVAGLAILAPHVSFFGLSGAASAWGPELVVLPTSLAAAALVHRGADRILAAVPRPGGPTWIRVGLVLLVAAAGLAAVGLALRAIDAGAAVTTERIALGAVGCGLAALPGGYLTAAAGRELWRSWHATPLLFAQAVALAAAALAPLSRGMLLPAAAAAFVWLAFALVLRFRRWPGVEGHSGARRLHRAALLGVPVADAAPALVLAAIPAGAFLPGVGTALTLAGLWGWTWAWLRAGAAASPDPA